MTALYIILAIAGYLAVGVGVTAIARSIDSIFTRTEGDAVFCVVFWFVPVVVAIGWLMFALPAKLALYLGDKCIERRGKS